MTGRERAREDTNRVRWLAVILGLLVLASFEGPDPAVEPGSVALCDCRGEVAEWAE